MMLGDAEFAKPRGCGAGKVRSAGRCMTPNKPVPSSRPEKKKMVLVKRGDRTKLVHYGAKGYSDYRKHKDPARRARFQKRHRAIKLKDGRPAHSDPFQPAYWSTKKAGGTWASHLGDLAEFKRTKAKKKLRDKTVPKTSGRFKGVSLKQDEKGFYVCTHRARSASYKSQADIPQSIVKQIERTG